MTTPATRILPLVIAACLVAPGAALAGPTASCDFIEIHASSAKDPSIPAELKPLEKKLKKPPFSSWNVFKQLSRATKTIEQNKAETVKLTMGQATVLLTDLDKGAKKTRIKLSVTMDDQNGKRVADAKVALDAGDYIVLGRNLPNDEGHLLAATCKP
jgi:hypothetical protein